MREHLQLWYREWLKAHAGTNLIYALSGDKKPTLSQVHFVRDHLAALFWADVPYDDRPLALEKERIRETALVIGTHHSKSVLLPVFLLERADLGLKVVLRYNYHDWNISVVSENPIDSDLSGFALDYSSQQDKERFPNGYRPGYSWGYCFFQGFPEEYRFGPYRENNRKFSIYCGTDYETYTFLWLVLRDLRKGA